MGKGGGADLEGTVWGREGQTWSEQYGERGEGQTWSEQYGEGGGADLE